MKHVVRRRYWIELGAAVLSAALLALTLVTREWIEVLTGFDPDGGSGALEWGIVAVLAAVAVVSAVVARVEWRRARPALA